MRRLLLSWLISMIVLLLGTPDQGICPVTPTPKSVELAIVCGKIAIISLKMLNKNPEQKKSHP